MPRLVKFSIMSVITLQLYREAIYSHYIKDLQRLACFRLST